MSKSFDFTRYIKTGLARAYLAQHSENIKRGIRLAKERQKKNDNK